MSRNKGFGAKLFSFGEKWVSERDYWVEKRDFEPSSGCTEGETGSGKVGMRKVLLGRVWAKMGLLQKMGVGKGHLSRNKRFEAKLGSLGKVGVRKGLFGRQNGL